MSLEPYQELEQRWAEFNQLDPAGMVCVSSGTAALHLSLEAMRLPHGAQCIVPDLTMIAVPRAVRLARLVPVFVDCDETLNMDMNLLGRFVGADYRTNESTPKAIIVVHTYGRRANMQVFDGADVDEFTTHPTILIEDSAEAHGIRPHPTTDAMCTSFYKNKIIAGAEGGAVWFRDPEHAALARQLRSLGFTDAHDFTHVARGHNYRMSNVHAALVLDSLKRVDLTLENRWTQWEAYNELCPQEWRMKRPDAPWVYAFRCKEIVDWLAQDKVVAELRRHGIEGRHCFKPSHMQEEYRNCKVVNATPNVSRLAARQVMYLPLSSYNVQVNLNAFNVVKRILDT